MTTITIDKTNFGKIIDKFYYIINNDKSIIINYKLEENKETSNMKHFFEKIENSPISSNINPLTFQQDVRNEWK